MSEKIRMRLIVSILLYLPICLFANLEPEVAVYPDSTNQLASYTISVQLDPPSPWIQLESNIDSIVIEFNPYTILPSSINPAMISVNATPSGGVRIGGQRLAILVPVDIRNFLNGTRNFTIRIPKECGIRNPSRKGSYKLEVALVNSEGTSLCDPFYSTDYMISRSRSKLEVFTVVPGPPIISKLAAYHVLFKTGASGYLKAGLSRISIKFDNRIYVPNGTLSGVTVNGTGAIATGSMNTAVITTPLRIDSREIVRVSFAAGSGIRNPISPGKFIAAVKTSSERTYINSPLFSISDGNNLTISDIAVTPNRANAIAAYEINFLTGPNTNLVAGSDTVSIVFEENTGLPDIIVPSDVVVNIRGYSDYAVDVQVFNRQITNEDTLKIVMPIDAGPSTPVKIKIDERAGILNPSEMGRYRIAVFSNNEPEKSFSNQFLVNKSNTNIRNVFALPGSAELNQTSSYSIHFETGNQGKLKSGKSVIRLSFPKEFGFSSSKADYDSISLSVSENNPFFLGEEQIRVDKNRKTIALQIPKSVNIKNNARILVQLGGMNSQPIINPLNMDNYTIGVSTSVEATPVLSEPFTIGGTALTFEDMFVSDSIVNNTSAYAFAIRPNTALKKSDSDYIQITFPGGTELPEIISSPDITINGSEAHSVSIVQSTRTVRAVVPQFIIGAGELIQIDFSKKAGILNPDIPSETAYWAILQTSKDITSVKSTPYRICGGNTHVSISDVSVNPAVKNMANVIHDINFMTSASGRLSGGTTTGAGMITIDFDTITYIPSGINANHVRVNDRVCSNVQVLNEGAGGKVFLSLPENLIVENNSPVRIHFESAAGLGIRNYFGDYQVRIRTSSDTVYTETGGRYHIEAMQSLVVQSVEVGSAIQNTSSAYSIRMTTGSEGKLAVGDSIHLTFPINTVLPASMSNHDIVVNGHKLTHLPKISGNILSIPLPILIDRMSSVILLINKGAGIFNPVLPGKYALKVATSSEQTDLKSPIYRIKKTTTTVSNARFISDPVTVALNAVYSVRFKTGSNGRLLDGESTITLTFDDGVLLNQSSADYDSSVIRVGNISTAIPISNLAISGQVLSFIVPENVLINNNEQVSVVLQGRGSAGLIRNPVSAGAYRIQIKTSVEEKNISSAPLYISSVPPIANVNASVYPDFVNAKSGARISFQVQRELNKSEGTITLTFPGNTFIPASIAPTTIRISHGKIGTENSNAVSAVTTNQAEHTVTMRVLGTISSGDQVIVDIHPDAGFENPTIPGKYSLKVRTNIQDVDSKSSTYLLKPAGTDIVNVSVNIVPNTPGAFSRVTYSFTTGSRGRLISAVSHIKLVLPGDNVFIQGVPAASKVTVNGVPAHSLKLKNTNRHTADTLIVTIPNSVSIGNETDVTVVIDSTSGLKNASSTAALTYEVSTSVETKLQADHYSLPVQLTSFSSESRSGYIVLEWLTDSKLEEAQWMIERKEISQLDYEAVQSGQKDIEAMGNSFDVLSYLEARESGGNQTRYSYVDSLVELGAVYAYRLADVNNNGSVKYHGVIYQDVTPASEFNLLKNIPNPFNTSTMIRYYLAEEAEVDIKIYDLVGQEISRLVDGVKKSGYQEVLWNASNRSGNPVASGMYVVSFQARGLRTDKEYTQLMKILLVR